MLNRRNMLIVGGAAAVGGAYALWPRDEPGLLPGVSAANAQGAAEIVDVTLGDPDAPVKVVEYASFTCPHCAAFHADTFKDFRAQYIETGKVHFTYREVFFDRYGLWAAMVARCAGPERYFGVADLIYRNQSGWARAGDPAEVVAQLKRIGAQAGLGQAELDACLEDGATAQALVEWYQANAASDGIRSTPSFLVDGELHAGNMSLSQLGQLVEDAGA